MASSGSVDMHCPHQVLEDPHLPRIIQPYYYYSTDTCNYCKI